MIARKRLSLFAKATLLTMVVAVVAPAAMLAGPAAAADKQTAKTPANWAKPVAATGMGTKAAMDNPRCNTGDQYGPYGRWDTASVGTGPTCVVPFKQGGKNGGATAPGVTADSIKVVAVLPSADRVPVQQRTAGATNTATNSASTFADAVHDYLFAHKDFYEQWGRDLDVTLYTSSGTDETAQRSDAVAIEGMKPFAVIGVENFGLSVLWQTLAKDKILVEGFGVNNEQTAALSPYLWGNNDSNAAAINSAEVIRKQLLGKKAEFGGDDVKSQPRKLGVVSITNQTDVDAFKKALGSKAQVVSEQTYDAPGSTLGDPATVQAQAPTLVQRMKDAGVTTVVNFADVSMTNAMMAQAEQQGWHPEWFSTGWGYIDLPYLVTSQPAGQANHTFGISILAPYFNVPADVKAYSGTPGNYTWFWGPAGATTSGAVGVPVDWLLQGIHYAGPNLTVKTFQQGLFSAPPSGGNPDDPLTQLKGYGRTTGLPYDVYAPTPMDFVPFWADTTTSGPAPGTGGVTARVNWYPGDATRYHGGTWPSSLPWFDTSKAITVISGYAPGLQPQAAPPCTTGQCPSTGASSPTPGIGNATDFTVAPSSTAVTSSS